LRRLRVEAGMTLEAAAAALEVSAATLSRIETGVRVPRARDVRDLCDLYGVDGERKARLMALVSEARETGWWEAYTEVDDDYGTYIGLEAAAGSIEEYAAMIIPGLLQAPDYARAHFHAVLNPGRRISLTDFDIEKRIEVRARRRQLLTGGLRYSALLDEATLRRPVGGVEVMDRQIRHLIELVSLPNVDIRLVPFDRGGHPGQGGSFVILNLPRDDVADVVYIESFAGQLFLETPAEVDRYRRVFAIIRDMAWDGEETALALRRLIDDQYP
jgi:transcriptional regulator with XRE-family HTH domain